MKILYIAHSSGLEGSGFALINIVKQVKQFGIIPYVMLPSEGKMSELLKQLNITYFIIRYENYIFPQTNKTIRSYITYFPRLFRNLILTFKAKKYCSKIVKEYGINIIHTNTSVIHFGADVAKANNILHFWHIREFQGNGSGYRPIWKMSHLLKKMKQKHNYCIGITKSIYQYYRLSSEKDLQIYDGVFSEKYSLNISYDKDNYLLYVGDLSINKGVLDTINAFDFIADEFPNIELWLVGNDIINISNIIINSPHKDRIKVLGFRNDIYSLMSKAKALLVPSYYEGFGFTVVEGMMNGCIVIGRNITGIKEQFDNGYLSLGKEIGLRFNNQQEYINLLRDICNSSFDKYIDMITDSQSVINKYTIERNIKEIVAYYNDKQLKYINNK